MTQQSLEQPQQRTDPAPRGGRVRLIVLLILALAGLVAVPAILGAFWIQRTVWPPRTSNDEWEQLMRSMRPSEIRAAHRQMARQPGMDMALRSLAAETARCIAEGPTLVVFLIDASRSTFDDEIRDFLEGMEQYVSQVELSPQLAGRGKWAVFSYGRDVKLHMSATTEIQSVLPAVAGVRIDKTNQKNLLAAVGKVLDKYEKADFKHRLLVVLTDERGSDTDDEALMARTSDRLKAGTTRVFAIAPEACLGIGRQKAWVTFADFHLWMFTNQGPACPRSELWHAPQRGGVAWVDATGIPSGFPIYTLERLAEASGGRYLRLTSRAEYDERKLETLYRPAVTAVASYEEQIATNPLKRELRVVWQEMERMKFPHRLSTDADMKAAIDRAEEIRERCDKYASNIAWLRRNTPSTGRNWRRWQAHADLTCGMLLRLKFLHGECAHALGEFRREGGQIEYGKCLIVSSVRSEIDVSERPEAASELRTAKEALEYAMLQHRDTPWEVLARRISDMEKISFQCRMIERSVGDPPPPSG